MMAVIMDWGQSPDSLRNAAASPPRTMRSKVLPFHQLRHRPVRPPQPVLDLRVDEWVRHQQWLRREHYGGGIFRKHAIAARRADDVVRLSAFVRVDNVSGLYCVPENRSEAHEDEARRQRQRDAVLHRPQPREHEPGRYGDRGGQFQEVIHIRRQLSARQGHHGGDAQKRPHQSWNGRAMGRQQPPVHHDPHSHERAGQGDHVTSQRLGPQVGVGVRPQQVERRGATRGREPDQRNGAQDGQHFDGLLPLTLSRQRHETGRQTRRDTVLRQHNAAERNGRGRLRVVGQTSTGPEGRRPAPVDLRAGTESSTTPAACRRTRIRRPGRRATRPPIVSRALRSEGRPPGSRAPPSDVARRARGRTLSRRGPSARSRLDRRD